MQLSVELKSYLGVCALVSWKLDGSRKLSKVASDAARTINDYDTPCSSKLTIGNCDSCRTLADRGKFAKQDEVMQAHLLPDPNEATA
jgi:hypothetical protein